MAYIVIMSNYVDIKKGLKVHFIGILGVSMSKLAEYLFEMGCIVSGSDSADSSKAAMLRSKGICVYIGHETENVQGKDLVVFTDAVKKDNEEVRAAVQLGIAIISRAALLGNISQRFNNVLATCGTHGKTTTTAMISAIFTEAQLHPTVHIGDSDSMCMGGNDYFITEACEYKRNFLSLTPSCALVTNIDCDHLDYFLDMADIYSCFEEFCSQSKTRIVCGDDMWAAKLGGMQYGLSEHCLLRGVDISINNCGCYAFSVIYEGQLMGRIELKVIGKHNMLNALGACLVSLHYGIDFSKVKTALEKYLGIARRQQYMGSVCGGDIMLDYAHHPREISAVIEAVRNIPYNKLYIAYEPHTYSRLKALMSDFCSCFTGTYCLYVLKVYAAREKKLKGVSSRKLCLRCRRNRITAIYCKNYEIAAQKIRHQMGKNDLLLVLGAGDIYKLVDLVKDCHDTSSQSLS